MFDFVRIVSTAVPKQNGYVVRPRFITRKSKDLMTRGGDFYAAWLEDEQRWTTDYDDVLDRIDKGVLDEVKRLQNNDPNTKYIGKLTMYADDGVIDEWLKFITKQTKDNYHTLNQRVIFADHEIVREDYASVKLEYALSDEPTPAYDKLISTLYDEENRHKLEWCIGSIVTGESRMNQKFAILYGAAGTGKSTMLNIIEKLFEPYCTTFNAAALGSRSNQFSMEAFTSSPLVAIQHDGDLSRIEDNSLINSIVSHEKVRVNEKFKRTYADSFGVFLFLGTNKYVKITDSKSGLIRRLLDISPSGNLLKKREYNTAVKQVAFELGGIANHCKQVYLEDPNAYDNYIPYSMMLESNDFYSFMVDMYHIFKKDDELTVKQAWEMYKDYVETSKVAYPMSLRQFKTEIMPYFKDIQMDKNGQLSINTVLSGFDLSKFPGLEVSESVSIENDIPDWLQFKKQESVLDKVLFDCPAQYAKQKGDTPAKSWDSVKTTLAALDTRKLHYVRVPIEHIVVDFDLKKDGEKNLYLNQLAAKQFPPTYAELSKSGKGIHLHYIYAGNPDELSSVFDENIEIKVYKGKSSLRRMLTLCNALGVASISSGLPKKVSKKVLNSKTMKDENHIRNLILKGLRKEVHANTTPSIDYIRMILDEAYESGVSYDVDDMHSAVLSFAMGSTNQAEKCIAQVAKMHFRSKDMETELYPPAKATNDDSPFIFFDIECYRNLFLVCWKEEGEGKTVQAMVNPKPAEVLDLMKHRLIGFNCRRYDNHMLYACSLGYSNEQLFELSKSIVNSKKGDKNNGMFGNAYNISYTDIYDYASKKQSLKKWEIELGIHHVEWGRDWDKPVPEELWPKVIEYCSNDVIATEATFNHTHDDYIARCILADLAGGIPNDTTNSLTTKLIFGNERNPELNYVDLATGKATNPVYQRTDIITAFPGYEYVNNKNMYRGVEIGRGGYILSNPGAYPRTTTLDVISMHPHSIIAMNLFGKYTQRFEDLVNARIAFKHGDVDSARGLYDGKLVAYLESGDVHPKQIASALKIAINSVYGLTAASFQNAFRDIRNKNNVVALRGALFMKTLQDEVEAMGFKVVAVKTDSIKIVEPTPDIIEYCMEFAKEYGYEFEIDDEFDRICQINDADYIARDLEGNWHATGSKFSEPVVFKSLFSRENLNFDDYVQVKSVQGGAIYMATSNDIPEEPLEHLDDFRFIGRVSSFVAVKPEDGGRSIFRVDPDKGQFGYVNGTKGWSWMEAELIRSAGEDSVAIDNAYYTSVIDDARDAIAAYCDFDNFVSNDELIRVGPWFSEENDEPPWDQAVGDGFNKR